MNTPSGKMLGDYLQRERKSRRVTVTAISKALKVDSSWIHTLENDDYNAFFDKKDIPDLLRRYAKFLLIDEDNLIRLYEIQSFIINSGKPTGDLLKDDMMKERLDVKRVTISKRRAWFATFSFILLVSLIILCIYVLSYEHPLLVLKEVLLKIYETLEL